MADAGERGVVPGCDEPRREAADDGVSPTLAGDLSDVRRAEAGRVGAMAATLASAAGFMSLFCNAPACSSANSPKTWEWMD